MKFYAEFMDGRPVEIECKDWRDAGYNGLGDGRHFVSEFSINGDGPYFSNFPKDGSDQERLEFDIATLESLGIDRESSDVLRKLTPHGVYKVVPRKRALTPLQVKALLDAYIYPNNIEEHLKLSDTHKFQIQPLIEAGMIIKIGEAQWIRTKGLEIYIDAICAITLPGWKIEEG